MYTVSGKRLTNSSVFLPFAQELGRRMRHNRSLASHGGLWLPIAFGTQAWIMYFERWIFETFEDLDYLPLWVKEEYLAKVRSNGLLG